MNKKTFLIINILILNSALVYAQDITMDLGGLNHAGVYQTEPLREYTKTNWKTELKGAGQANLIIKDSVLYVSSMIGTYSNASRLGFIYAIDCKWKNNLAKRYKSEYICTNTKRHYSILWFR